MRRFMRGRSAALCLMCLCIGCTRSSPGYYGTTEPKHPPDELWTNLASEPETIDPGKADESNGGMVIANIFAGLVQPHPVTLDPMPDIAERWEVSQDGKRYTFYLRPSTWSDGTPLTAADFEWSWRRVLDPNTGSKYASFLYPLRYGEMFNRRALVVRGVGEASEAELRKAVEAIGPIEVLRMAPELDGAFVVVGGDESARPALRKRMLQALQGRKFGARTLQVSPIDGSLVGVHADGPLRLVVDLETPLPYFLHLVKFFTAMPVPRHVIEALEKRGLSADLWTRPEYIVSNGPYVIESAKFRQYLRLKKNPRYWDASHVRMPRVRLAMIESSNTTLNMYQAGELDTIGTGALPSEFMDTLSTRKDFRSGPFMATYFYWINTKRPPLDDVRVRNALRLAIDRETLVKRITRGGQLPTSDLVPPGLGGYPGLHSPIYDPERARQLLKEAGYDAAHPLPKITLSYNTSEGHKQLAEALQSMWHEQLGIDVELNNQEWKVFLSSLDSGDFQIARMGWVGDYPDPYTFLEIATSQSGNNRSGWHDAQYDQLLRRANATLDPRARLAILAGAERLLMDASPLIPIYVYTRSELVKPYVMGDALNYADLILLKYMWIDRRWYHGTPRERLSDDFPAPPMAAALGGLR